MNLFNYPIDAKRNILEGSDFVERLLKMFIFVHKCIY